jgi:hypothetical protein
MRLLAEPLHSGPATTSKVSILAPTYDGNRKSRSPVSGPKADRILAICTLLLERDSGMAHNRSRMRISQTQAGRPRCRRLSAALLPWVALALLSTAPAAALDAAMPQMQADELLRRAVANEQPSEFHGYYAWLDRIQKPRGSVTKLMVNTPQGILSRTVAINDRELSPSERQRDDARIDRLLDAGKMREKAKKQHADEQHVERLLRTLPVAFHCSYAPGGGAPDEVTLECAPRPEFSPPNYESRVLVGMKTEITINRRQMRMTRVVGTLVRDVNLGWGFLARLNRGGRIELQQSQVAGQHWGITHIEMSFDGRLCVVKPIHVEETESNWNYRAVPEMNVAQALDFLRSGPSVSTVSASRE